VRFSSFQVDNFFGEADDFVLDGYIPSGIIHQENAGTLREDTRTGDDAQSALCSDMMGMWASPSSGKIREMDDQASQEDEDTSHQLRSPHQPSLSSSYFTATAVGMDASIPLQNPYYSFGTAHRVTRSDLASAHSDTYEVVIVGPPEEEEECVAGSEEAEAGDDHDLLPERALQLLRQRISPAVVEGEQDDSVYTFEEG
jgi:hypothetical protein